MSTAICGDVPQRMYIIKSENRSQKLQVKKVNYSSPVFRSSEGRGKCFRTIFGTVLPELGTWKLPTRNQVGLAQV